MGAAASSTPKASKGNVGHQTTTHLTPSTSLDRPVRPMEDDVFSAPSQPLMTQPTQVEAGYSDLIGDEEMDSPTPAYKFKSDRISRKGEIPKTPFDVEVRFTCVKVYKEDRVLTSAHRYLCRRRTSKVSLRRATGQQTVWDIPSQARQPRWHQSRKAP